MPGQVWPDRFRNPAFQVAILLIVALVFGGGGVAYGLNNLVVQLAALALLAINRAACCKFWREAPLALKLLIASSLAMPLLQLIPLPFAIWSTLPGRELAQEAFLASGGAGWHAFSLDPARTLVAALGLITPITVMLLGWRASPQDLTRLAIVVVALGMANFVLGIPQVLSQGQTAIFYPENPMPGVLFGSFANRNSTGLFLVTCLALLCLVRPGQQNAAVYLISLALGVLLTLGIILTQSRSAMVLALLPLGLCALRWALGRRNNKGLLLGGGAGIVALLAVLALSLSPATRIDTALERFESGGTARMQIWEDAAYSAQRYWPLGAGMGTFDEVFQADESLEHLSPRKAGRAHNDYLEVAIEAGLPGLTLIAAWLIWIGWQAVSARRSRYRWQVWAGAAILLTIALQSITDYPLRNQAMLAMAAFALLLVMKRSQDSKDRV